MSAYRMTLEAWCKCGGEMRVDLNGIASLEPLQRAFKDAHLDAGCGPATKEEAAAARRKQNRRRQS